MNATPNRPPLPALLAMALLALAPLFLVYNGAWHLVHGELVGLVLLPGIAVWALVLRGLWQGGHGAYVIALVIAGLIVLAALAAPDPDHPWHRIGALIQLAQGVGVLVLLRFRRSRTFYALR